MRVFEVIWEEDGRTIKEPGVTETIIKKVSAYYGADSFDAVFTATDWIRKDPERAFKGIHEVLQTVTVVGYQAVGDCDGT